MNSPYTHLFTPIAKYSFALCCYLTCISHAQSEWDINSYIGLTSNYVYRGISLTGDVVTPKASVSFNHDSGIFLNTWVAQEDISGVLRNSDRRDTEFEFNLGYHWQFQQSWAFTLSHAWLEYDQRHQPADHDYRELRAHLHYKDQLSFFAAHTDSIWNTDNDLTTLSVTTRLAAPFSTLFETELGWNDFSTNPRTDFLYTRFSLGKSLSDHWLTTLEYNYSQSRANNFFNSSRTGSQWSAGISYHF